MQARCLFAIDYGFMLCTYAVDRQVNALLRFEIHAAGG
jgi:hypothetical protein